MNARGTFERHTNGMRASMPAGATWDWVIDLSNEMTATSDTILSATWTLAAGLTAGTVTTTTTRCVIFITAPATPSVTPYLVSLKYVTAGGRTTPKNFYLYVSDPILFTA